MVDLVLDGAGQQAAPLDPDRLAVAVERLADHLVGTRHLPHHAGDGEAALVGDLLPVRLDDLGVGEVEELVVHLDRDDPNRDVDLGGRQPDAGRGDHRLHHVVHEAADRIVDLADLGRPAAENGVVVGDGDDLEDGHLV